MKIHCLHSKSDIHQFDAYDSQMSPLKSDKLENKRIILTLEPPTAIRYLYTYKTCITRRNQNVGYSKNCSTRRRSLFLNFNKNYLNLENTPIKFLLKDTNESFGLRVELKKNVHRRWRKEVENISDRRGAREGVARNILEINVNANDDIQLHRKHPVQEADLQSGVAGETERKRKDRKRKEGGTSGWKKLTVGGGGGGSKHQVLPHCKVPLRSNTGRLFHRARFFFSFLTLLSIAIVSETPGAWTRRCRHWPRGVFRIYKRPEEPLVLANSPAGDSLKEICEFAFQHAMYVRFTRGYGWIFRT